MKGSIKLLGHSVHPILIVFPLGLLTTGVIFDAIYLIGGNGKFSSVAYWMIASGIIGGIAAAAFGWLDWFAIPSDTRAKTVGLIHGSANATALLVFAASWWLRYGTETDPPMTAHVLSFLGAGLALVGGWLGGELVERMGVSVHEGANLNAPSSLSTESPIAVEKVYAEK